LIDSLDNLGNYSLFRRCRVSGIGAQRRPQFRGVCGLPSLDRGHAAERMDRGVLDLSADFR
jgi:hypothetical protein